MIETVMVIPLLVGIMASVFCCCRGLDRSFKSGGSRTWLALSGLMAGFACGTKYYAAICPFLLALFILNKSWRERVWAPLALFAGATALPVLPWLAKNWAYAGNPVFPFLHKLFPGSGGEWSAMASRYFLMLAEYGHPKGEPLA